MQRHSLKVGCDVEDYAEDNVEEEMAETDCVWGVGEDAGGDKGKYSKVCGA